MTDSRTPGARWRGLDALVHDAVAATTGLVWEGHEAAHRGVRRVTNRVDGLAGPARVVSDAVRLGTAGTLASVTAVDRVVQALTGAALDAALPDDGVEGPPIPLRSDLVGTPAWLADAALGLVNGAIGDHLAATGNPLDLGLAVRRGDRYLDPDQPEPLTGAVVVLVHGLATTEWCWAMDALDWHGDPAATFGSMLERDLGCSALFVRYNTGRRIEESGRALADALEGLLAGGGVDRVVLVGHSMGGLVARSACRAASEQGHAWLRALDLVVALGTPHQGAPLARFGEAAAAGLGSVDLPATQVLSRLIAGRSAGIRDLEHGSPDADVPLLEGVRYAFLSATVTADPAHPVGRWMGDLMVQPGSASGPVLRRSFPLETGTLGGVLHHQLQCHPEVYAQVRDLLGR